MNSLGQALALKRRDHALLQLETGKNSESLLPFATSLSEVP
jgi:hypothetical protein